MARPKNKGKFSVGLDIGTQSIKFIKIKFDHEKAQLCDFGLEPSALDPLELLKKLKQSQGLDSVNIGLSGSSTVTRYVNFPKMSQQELKQAMKFEAQKHIPFSPEEINLDAAILKDDLPDNKMLVLLAAVKKDFLTQRLKLLEDAELKVSLLDIDSIALVNAFNYNYPLDESFRHKGIGLLNIGAAVTNLNIIEDGIPRLSRDMHIAGNDFTQKIADIFSVDFIAAENLKFNPDDKEKATKVSAAVESVLMNLISEIRTSFDYYESQSSSSAIKIFLSGGGAKFAGLKDMLANLLGIEVECWDPFKQITLPSNIDAEKLKTLSIQFPVAVGLALRG